MLPEFFDFSCRNKTSHIEFIVDYRNLTSQLIAVVEERKLTADFIKLLFFRLFYFGKFSFNIFQLYIKLFYLSVKLCRCSFTIAVKKIRKTYTFKIKASEDIVYLHAFFHRGEIQSPDIAVLFFKRLENETFFTVELKLCIAFGRQFTETYLDVLTIEQILEINIYV